MKLETDVLNSVYLLLTDVRPLFKYRYPDTNTETSFAVINTLGVPKDSVQTVEVNVNCYALDVQDGVPSFTALTTMVNKVLAKLHNFNNDTFDVEYLGGQIFREKEYKWHYFNLRFQLIYINN